jgi:hypothetical protein
LDLLARDREAVDADRMRLVRVSEQARASAEAHRGARLDAERELAAIRATVRYRIGFGWRARLGPGTGSDATGGG